MAYRKHVLKNGLSVLADSNPNAHFSSFGFYVRTGARDETPELGGVSHFLEHMVFKGTPTRSADDVNELLDALGSSSNAATSVENTYYYASVLPEFQDQVVGLLADLMRPSLRDDDFETEKKVIVEEILMYQDQPPYGGHEKIMTDYFGGHPLANSVLGTVESVEALTSVQMREYFECRYCPENMAICAAGRVDFDGLCRQAEELCGHWESGDPARSTKKSQPAFGFEILHRPDSALEYVIQLSPGPCKQDADRYAARVAATILGDDSGSRMYWEFIDSGRAETAGMGGYEYHDDGVIMSVLSCQPDQSAENVRRLKELQEKAREGVTAKELQLARSKIAAHILLSRERTPANMFSVGAQWLDGLEYADAAEIARRYDSVTLDQVNSILGKYDLTQNMTLAIGPLDGFPQ